MYHYLSCQFSCPCYHCSFLYPCSHAQDASCLFHYHLYSSSADISHTQNPLFHVHADILSQEMCIQFSLQECQRKPQAIRERQIIQVDRGKSLFFCLQCGAASNADSAAQEQRVFWFLVCVDGKSAYMYAYFTERTWVLIHPTLFLHAVRYMSCLWSWQLCPVFVTSLSFYFPL